MCYFVFKSCKADFRPVGINLEVFKNVSSKQNGKILYEREWLKDDSKKDFSNNNMHVFVSNKWSHGNTVTGKRSR